jgi:uncharacterized protein YndB with AHSA1/START domain
MTEQYSINALYPTRANKFLRHGQTPNFWPSGGGPKGFTNTFHTFELKPNGKWHFTMHGPDGTDYENLCVFEEIVSPERVVLYHLETVHKFRLSGIFTKADTGTHVEFRQVFESAEECQRIRSFVTEANEQNLDRLEAVLQKLK